MIKRILIIGLGSIGKRHLRIARELNPEADIRVLRHQKCSYTPEYSDGCFFSIEQALVFKPQLAVIANPANFHMGKAQPLAEIGTHLLIEKPLSISTDGIEQLIETCRKNKIVLLVGYNLRYLPSLKKFRDLLREKIIGKIFSVRGEIGQYLPTWRPDTNYKESVSARRDLGGGVLLELSHEIDYMRWIFGEVDWVKASLSKQSNLEVNVEDTAHLILGFDSLSNNENQLIGSLNIDFIRHDKTRLCTVIGETGTLRWNGVTEKVELFEINSKEWCELYQYEQHRDDTYILEWKHFLDCVENQQTPIINGIDGLKVLNIINAARQASKYKKQCKVLESKDEGSNSI